MKTKSGGEPLLHQSLSEAHTSSKRFINSYSSPKHNICVNWQPFLHRTNYPHLYGPYNNSRADMHWDIFCVCPLTIFKHCCINHSVSSTLFFFQNFHSLQNIQIIIQHTKGVLIFMNSFSLIQITRSLNKNYFVHYIYSK